MQPEIEKSVVSYNGQDFLQIISKLTKEEKQELLKMWAERTTART